MPLKLRMRVEEHEEKNEQANRKADITDHTDIQRENVLWIRSAMAREVSEKENLVKRRNDLRRL